MDWGLLTRVLEQVRALGWGTTSTRAFVEMFGVNEPLMNKRLLQELVAIRAAAPRATIYASTNGDVLAKKRNPLEYLRELHEAGLTSLNMNVYDAGGEGTGRLLFYDALIKEAIGAGFARRNDVGKYKYRPRSSLWLAMTDMRLTPITSRKPGKMDIVFPKPNELRKELRAPEKYCARPHRHLFLDYLGRVPLCCATDLTMPAGGFYGDATKQSLMEIWNSEGLFRARYLLQSARRSALPDCDTCLDSPAFPHVVRKVTASTSRIATWERHVRRYQRERDS
jgi:MoaA/NifB/PqqE/SkfB family radical SAM enzyme